MTDRGLTAGRATGMSEELEMMVAERAERSNRSSGKCESGRDG
jgi:hypothetical protein